MRTAWWRASAIVGTTGLLALAAASAQAGEWVQVSCKNPNGSSAPSEGWSTQSGGSLTEGSSVSADCSNSSPMFAEIPATTAGGSFEMLIYTPPAGSRLIGGTLDALLDGDGGGASGDAVLYEPTFSYPGGVFYQCAESLPDPCYGGAGFFQGAVALPSDAGGDLFVEASCSSAGSQCTPGGPNNDVSKALVYSAELTLSNTAAVGGRSFRGSAVQRKVFGHAHLLFTASDPGGPGIYRITAVLGHHTVYNATPSTNGGECVAVNPPGSIGPLMFDYQQPCPQTLNVDVPVPTSRLRKGVYELRVSVTDAAGNTATVFDQNIKVVKLHSGTTSTGHTGAIDARFVIHWQWLRRRTWLRSMLARKLPHDATVTITCAGGGCPTLAHDSVAASGLKTLLAELKGLRFRAGDWLSIAVSARGRRAERIRIRIRDGHVPLATLLAP